VDKIWDMVSCHVERGSPLGVSSFFQISGFMVARALLCDCSVGRVA
jgi:peptidoglycan/LPS O-acetylase OafA/YrhL